jgi:hypothetical protein
MKKLLNVIGNMNGVLSKNFRIIILVLTVVAACTHDPFLDPNSLNDGKPSIPGCTPSGEICFETNVLPIFISACARPGCHDSETHEDGYNLSSYTTIVRKGIKPGDAADSKLYEVLFESGEDRMPPDGSVTAAQKDSIAAWINQGARNTTNCACSCDSTQYTYSIQIKAILDRACVGCHKPTELNGDINLSDYSHVKLTVDDGSLLGSIKHAVGYVPMPQGTKLSQCEIRLVEKWIENGALND